jgi:hypothetical protein
LIRFYRPDDGRRFGVQGGFTIAGSTEVHALYANVPITVETKAIVERVVGDLNEGN